MIDKRFTWRVRCMLCGCYAQMIRDEWTQIGTIYHYECHNSRCCGYFTKES